MPLTPRLVAAMKARDELALEGQHFLLNTEPLAATGEPPEWPAAKTAAFADWVSRTTASQK